ncbi:MAG: PEP-CTERM sorting domain-containing protein [Planctomycetaceae bacterium]|nr:PEP-CTERM sorting domain-containing protein [Planctomycetaceae bacterium]
MNTKTALLILGLISAASLTVSTASATIIGGVDFPQGALSFADAVVDYTPHIDIPDPYSLTGESPDPQWRNPADALGVPNFTPPVGSTHNLGQFVSLGNGGFLTLQFTNNKLTGSGDSGDDLHIFEVGPLVEDTKVWISQDGVIWLFVGLILGSTRGVDIDAVLAANLLPPATQFGYVRLQDDPAHVLPPNEQYGFYAGADIDAVGAISSIPEPATMVLLLLGGAGALLCRSGHRA